MLRQPSERDRGYRGILISFDNNDCIPPIDANKLLTLESTNMTERILIGMD